MVTIRLVCWQLPCLYHKKWFPLVPIQLPSLANKYRLRPYTILLYQMFTMFLQLRHRWTVTQSGRCNIPHRKWCTSLNYSSHRKMGIGCLQNIYPEKPCPNSSLAFWANRMSLIIIHPRFGLLTPFLQTFSLFFASLQTRDFYRLFCLPKHPLRHGRNSYPHYTRMYLPYFLLTPHINLNMISSFYSLFFHIGL